MFFIVRHLSRDLVPDSKGMLKPHSKSFLYMKRWMKNSLNATANIGVHMCIVVGPPDWANLESMGGVSHTQKVYYQEKIKALFSVCGLRKLLVMSNNLLSDFYWYLISLWTIFNREFMCLNFEGYRLIKSLYWLNSKLTLTPNR